MTRNVIDRYAGTSFNNTISADFLRDETNNLRWYIARVQELLYMSNSCGEDVEELETQLEEAADRLRQIETFLKRVDYKEHQDGQA